MVLITPHVVDDARKAKAVTDELRKKLPEVQPLFEPALNRSAKAVGRWSRCCGRWRCWR